MQDINSIKGQWFGYFSYGPEYGPELEGHKVTFSLLIEELGDGQFKGKCIELEGIGASQEVSLINGFAEDGRISFTKEYTTYMTIDEDGVEGIHKDRVPPRISYIGSFQKQSGSFHGTWEIWANEVLYGDGSFVEISTGRWEISRESALYGV